jgi:hypothetical protein
MFQSWLISSPLLGWGLAHPILGLTAAVAAVVLLGGLLRAIAQLTEQLWVKLLQMPMRVGQWLFFQLLCLLKVRPRTVANTQNLVTADSLKLALNETNTSEPDQQMYEIMVRLERLQQEQTLLLQDIKTLLVNRAKKPV